MARAPRWKDTDVESIRRKYPIIYRNPECSVSFPAGWTRMVDELSARLEAIASEQRPLERILVAQVKSKYGGLCFYADNLTPDADKIIAKAEERSSMVCEVCGATDATNYDENSWYVTKCERCKLAHQVMKS